MEYRELSVREPAVQELLWRHLEPTDIHPEYTKLDAIKYLEGEILKGNQFLWGDETALLRCEGNKFTGVITPHILGDGFKFRSLLAQGLEYAKSMNKANTLLGADATRWTQVYIWTTRGAIQKMALRLGFEQVGLLNGYHATPNGNTDIAILRKEL